MAPKRALQTILAIAIVGVAFSGFLTWRELFANAESCAPVAAGGSILGYPPCIYGLAMYAALVAVAVMGLMYGRRGPASLT